MVRGNKSLIISLSLLSDNLFTNKVLVISYTLGKNSQILFYLLLDTGATGVVFIDKAMARYMCNILKISFLSLAKPKLLKVLTKTAARPIIHAIYSTLTVQGYFKLLTLMLITLLGQYPIILKKP